MKTQIFKIRMDDHFLKQDQKVLDDFIQEHSVLKYETAFVQEEESFWSVILFFQDKENMVKEKKSPKYAADNDEMTNDEAKVFEVLKEWRFEKSKEEGLPAYFIASNKELISLAKFRPIKKEELIDIKGFGRHKIENYGAEIIEVLENV